MSSDHPLKARFAAAMSTLHTAGPLAVAVSGGPDSMALLALATDWAKARGLPLAALTVNHQLRAAAAAEATAVADWCAARDIPHQILLWERDGSDCGNLQAAARQARYQLIGSWCASYGIRAVAVAHHADDKAETLLMRLRRGSGVDGLAAMMASAPWPAAQESAPCLLRPLLNMRRAELIAFCEDESLPVAHDPSNQDKRFDRVATRQAIAALDLNVERLTRTADLMAEEKAALDWALMQAMKQVVQISPHGFVAVDREQFATLPVALAGRVLRHVVQGMGTASYPPRKEAVMRLRAAVIAGEDHNLAGIRLSRGGHLFPEQLPGVVNLPVGEEMSWGNGFTFTAREAGWLVVARARLAASAFSEGQKAQIATLPAVVRPILPVAMGPDGTPYLPTFGEIGGKVGVSDDLRAVLTLR